MNTEIDGNNGCINYAISAASKSPTSTKNTSQQLFFLKEDVFSPQYKINDVILDSGFQRSCSRDSDIFERLNPYKYNADRFFSLPSGELIVPHRFWFFQPDDYCMEDVFFDKDVNNVSFYDFFFFRFRAFQKLIFIFLGKKNSVYLFKWPFPSFRH